MFAAASLAASCGGGGDDPTAGLVVPETPPASADATLPDGLKSPLVSATHCHQLVATTYRFISPRNNGSFADTTGTFTVDPVNLTATGAGVAIKWKAGARTCEFDQDGGDGQIVVSKAGVIVGRQANRPLIAFPVQSLTVLEVAAHWNLLGQENVGSGNFVTLAADIAFATTGAIFRFEACPGVKTCQPATYPTGTLLTVNPEGGFDLAPPGFGNNRLFAYRAGGEELMMVMLRDNGSFSLMTRRRTRTLPDPGTTFKGNWNLPLTPQLRASPLFQTNVKVESADSSARSFMRTVQTPSVSDTHAETVFINQPHTGYQYSPRSGAYQEWALLPMRGFDLTVTALTETQELMFSVAQD